MKITHELLKDKLKDFYLLWDKNDFKGLYNNIGIIDFYFLLRINNRMESPIKNPSSKEIEEELEKDDLASDLTSIMFWTENPSAYYGLEYSAYINFDTGRGDFSKRKQMSGDSIEKDFLLSSLIKDPLLTYKKMINFFESLRHK